MYAFQNKKTEAENLRLIVLSKGTSSAGWFSASYHMVRVQQLLESQLFIEPKESLFLVEANQSQMTVIGDEGN
jgi:hypothetical protein